MDTGLGKLGESLEVARWPVQVALGACPLDDLAGI